jgi:hypothetical protein
MATQGLCQYWKFVSSSLEISYILHIYINFLHITYIYTHIYVYRWKWSLNSGLHICKAGTILLEPHLQSICSGYFGDAWAGFKLHSSWSQSSKLLQLQIWATSAWHIFDILIPYLVDGFQFFPFCSLLFHSVDCLLSWAEDFFTFISFHFSIFAFVASAFGDIAKKKSHYQDQYQEDFSLWFLLEVLWPLVHFKIFFAHGVR